MSRPSPGATWKEAARRAGGVARGRGDPHRCGVPPAPGPGGGGARLPASRGPWAPSSEGPSDDRGGPGPTHPWGPRCRPPRSERGRDPGISFLLGSAAGASGGQGSERWPRLGDSGFRDANPRALSCSERTAGSSRAQRSLKEERGRSAAIGPAKAVFQQWPGVEEGSGSGEDDSELSFGRPAAGRGPRYGRAVGKGWARTGARPAPPPRSRAVGVAGCASGPPWLSLKASHVFWGVGGVVEVQCIARLSKKCTCCVPYI